MDTVTKSPAEMIFALNSAGEFDDAPPALRAMLAQPLGPPFCIVVRVIRAAGLFDHQREPLQVRAIGFDCRRPGVLRGGWLVHPDEWPAEPPASRGELSHLLYAPRS